MPELLTVATFVSDDVQTTDLDCVFVSVSVWVCPASVRAMDDSLM